MWRLGLLTVRCLASLRRPASGVGSLGVDGFLVLFLVDFGLVERVDQGLRVNTFSFLFLVSDGDVVVPCRRAKR